MLFVREFTFINVLNVSHMSSVDTSRTGHVYLGKWMLSFIYA
jgi:hypothetical protein